MANTLHMQEEAQTFDLRPGDKGYDPFDDLWSRLARPMAVSYTHLTLPTILRV